MSEAVRLEVVTNLERLHESSELWRPHAATPFHSPEWLLTWWRHFGSGNLHTVLLWHGETLVGMLPCFQHQWQGATQLTLLGSGITDYVDPWVAADHAPCIAGHVLRGDWQVCNWQDLSFASPFLNRPIWQGAAVEIQPEVSASAIQLEGSFENFWQRRSKDLRRNLRRYRDRAEQSGPLEFSVTHQPDPELLDTLIRLHGLRWQKRGQTGMVEQNHSAAFLRDVSQAFAHGSDDANPILQLFQLGWKGEIVAMSLGFAWRKRLYSYLSAFLPEHEILGFGRILLYESIRHIWAQGFTAWDFLRGEESYKTSWGAIAQPRYRLIVRRS